MNIAVYCGSTPVGNSAFNAAATALGEWIGSSGHTLVWGGCKSGLMGVVADAAAAQGASLLGVVPDVESIKARMYPSMTEVVYTQSLADRKSAMIERADAFVALPGGFGTLDEISDIFALVRLGKISQPVVLVNAEGFYEPLKAQFDTMIEAGFMTERDLESILFSDSMEHIADHIERVAWQSASD